MTINKGELLKIMENVNDFHKRSEEEILLLQKMISETPVAEFIRNTCTLLLTLDASRAVDCAVVVSLTSGIEIGYELGKQHALKEMLEGK